jgi:hypothetical protein
MRSIDVPPGTVFGRLTVIEETTTAGGRRAMLCRCECSKQKVVDLAKLRSGHTKSCGCWRWEINLASADRGEIPLYGKVAAGRVALIDEEDFELVAPYRWNVREVWKNGHHVSGPYALTSLSRRDHGGKAPTLLMHVLIMGQPWVDHVNGNGIDNRRSNLRLATPAQNAANRRMRQSGISQYKGVALVKASGRWIAHLGNRHLGVFSSELSAAYAYDLAAREAYGEFAFTNFDPGPPQAVLDAWHAEESGWGTPEHRQAMSAIVAETWNRREPETRTCTVCGGEYQSKTIGRSFYCSRKCGRAKDRKRLQEQQDGRLF